MNVGVRDRVWVWVYQCRCVIVCESVRGREKLSKLRNGMCAGGATHVCVFVCVRGFVRVCE